MATTPPPLTCTLSPAALADRGAAWAQVDTSAVERVHLTGRLQIRYRAEPGLVEIIEALAAAERQCCGWASWDVIPVEEGHCTLVVTGPPDQVAALADAFGVAADA
ncbi:MAG: hypothetical protein ABIS47_03990 [Acidimicrobiales bacterium]